jgi:hypothetical protein
VPISPDEEEEKEEEKIHEIQVILFLIWRVFFLHKCNIVAD